MSDIKKKMIGRNWLAADAVSENRNPADPDDLIGIYARGGAADVKAAVAAVKAAAPGWAAA
jgi:acyl-CoA reductase-like NAD-dependent aldehyde dehydrogenase